MTTTKAKMNTPEAAYRLRSRKTVDHEARRQQESKWNGNGLGATNGSSDYKPLVRIVDGLPVEYSCKDDPRQGTSTYFDPADLRIMTIRFDYEMATTPEADFDRNLKYLEWSVLWNVAHSIGLHNCNIKKQDASLGDRRLQPSTSENFVLVLSSLESDEADQDTDFCTFLNSDEGNVCTPVKGVMTAEYIGDKDIVERYLLTHIAKEVNSKRVRIEQVEQSRYVGDRENLQLLAESRTDLDSKNSSINIGLVVGVLAGLLVLVFAVFLARGKRRRKNRKQPYVEDDASFPASVQAVTVAKSDQAVASLDVSSEDSEGTEDSCPDNAEKVPDIEPRAPVGVKTTILAALAFEPTPTHEADDQADPKEQISKKNYAVPPRPPLSVVPVEESATGNKIEKSKTLVPRRKRKKKKKKQRVLQRVSSKNSINEMETIQEDEDDFEFEGSDYSTDDEEEAWMGLNITTASGNNNEEINATRDKTEQTSPSVSPGNVVPPSPIQEEPKIKRLPPPWI